MGGRGGTPFPQEQEQYACLPLALMRSTVNSPDTVPATTSMVVLVLVLILVVSLLSNQTRPDARGVRTKKGQRTDK
jgi:hypothetical protein